MFWLFVFALVGVDCFCCAVFVLSFILYVVVSLIIFWLKMYGFCCTISFNFCLRRELVVYVDFDFLVVCLFDMLFWVWVEFLFGDLLFMIGWFTGFDCFDCFLLMWILSCFELWVAVLMFCVWRLELVCLNWMSDCGRVWYLFGVMVDIFFCFMFNSILDLEIFVFIVDFGV